jgi:hypothetical protein
MEISIIYAINMSCTSKFFLLPALFTTFVSEKMDWTKGNGTYSTAFSQLSYSFY